MNKSLTGAHILMGSVYLLKKEHEKGLVEFEQAMAISPNSAITYANMGKGLYNIGKPKEAITIIKKAIRLNPFPRSLYFYFLGTAYFLDVQYDEAITAYKKAIHLQPKNIFARIILTATFALSGHEDEARAQAAEVLRINPRFSLDYWAKIATFKNQNDTDRMIEGLRLAGLK